MKYHKDGSTPDLSLRTIFVFGSNLAGVHGAGAAAYAHEELGARWGIGQGFTGLCYALPTKDRNIRSRKLSEINEEVITLLENVKRNPQLEFFVTRVGCGLAGFKDSQIAPMFKGFPDNCTFPEVWQVYLEES